MNKFRTPRTTTFCIPLYTLCNVDTNQANSNGNGIGNLCDVELSDQDLVDSDNDFSYDIRDNCPRTFNPDQKDADTDGIGDLCDSTSGPDIVR